MSNKATRYSHSHFDYDSLNDSFYVYPQERNYESSLLMGDLVLDINESRDIVGIEILNASEKFGLNKYEFLSPVKLRASIRVEGDEMHIDLKFTYNKRNHHIVKSLSVASVNDMDLSPGTTTLAAA
jgi:uncharacterized protein YuzE